MNGAVGSGSDRPFHSGRPTERHLPSEYPGQRCGERFRRHDHRGAACARTRRGPVRRSDGARL